MWQASTPILWGVLYFTGNTIPGTMWANFIGGCIFFFIDKQIFKGKDKTSTMYSVREFGNTCLLMSLDKVLEYGGVLNVPQADERERIVERKEVKNLCAFSHIPRGDKILNLHFN